MGKWLSNIINALILLGLTTLLGALLKGPIDDLANRNRIKAQVQLSPWVEKPSPEVEADEGNIDSDNPYREILNNLLEDLASNGASSDLYGLARINLENDSSNTVTDINFRMEGRDNDLDVHMIGADGRVAFSGETQRVQVPDMKPGDRVTVYVWGAFSEHLIRDNFKTYSSEGAFRTDYEWPDIQDFEYSSTIGKAFDAVVDWMLIFIVGLLLLFLFAINIFQEKYLKGLLGNQSIYLHEKRRFEKEGDKFAPDITGWSNLGTKAADASDGESHTDPNGNVETAQKDG